MIQSLGTRLRDALDSLHTATVLNQKVVEKLTDTICLSLIQADVNVHQVKQIRQRMMNQLQVDKMAAGQNKRKWIQTFIINELHSLVTSSSTSLHVLKKGNQSRVMFVGLQGAGKTTTCTKFAYYYKKKGWKVGLICADTFRAGAFDQLKQNAVKAKIPFYGSYQARDPVSVALQGLDEFVSFDMVIIDTSGRHKQADDLFEEMKELYSTIKPDQVILVIDSSIGQGAKTQAEAFHSAIGVGGIIVTKMDGHAKGGGALSAIASTQSPILFTGNGEHIGDFDVFDPKRFVTRLLGYTDMKGFTEQLNVKELSESKLVQKVMSKKKQPFTFGDMSEQITMFQKMDVTRYLPQNQMALTSLTALTPQNLKNYRIILDSLHKTELEADVKLFRSQPTRVQRVQRGSGSTPAQMKAFFEAFQGIQTCMQKIQNLTNKSSLKSSLNSGKISNQMLRQMKNQFPGVDLSQLVALPQK